MVNKESKRILFERTTTDVDREKRKIPRSKLPFVSL